MLNLVVSSWLKELAKQASHPLFFSFHFYYNNIITCMYFSNIIYLLLIIKLYIFINKFINDSIINGKNNKSNIYAWNKDNFFY